MHPHKLKLNYVLYSSPHFCILTIGNAQNSVFVEFIFILFYVTQVGSLSKQYNLRKQSKHPLTQTVHSSVNLSLLKDEPTDLDLHAYRPIPQPKPHSVVIRAKSRRQFTR